MIEIQVKNYKNLFFFFFLQNVYKKFPKKKSVVYTEIVRFEDFFFSFFTRKNCKNL